jgi:glycosyltransferase involved in cell wall biosynthesis
MKILFISPYLPSEKSGHAGAQLIFRNIASLSKKYKVTLACFINHNEYRALEILKELGISVYPILYFRNQRSIKNKIVSLIHNLESIFNYLKFKEPFFFAKYKKKKMITLLNRLVLENDYDLVQVEYNVMYHYIDIFIDIPKIINFHDVSTKVYDRASRYNSFNNRYFRIMKKIEPAIANKFDSVITLTKEDKKYLFELGCKTKINIIPPQIKIPKDSISFKKLNEICFIGSFNRVANCQAVGILLEKIVPKLPSNIKLNIIGKGLPNRFIEKIKQNNRVNYLGFINDIDSFISTQMIMVSPIMIGAGIKMKNLHSLACSTAVLTTKIGAEGININEENGMWVCNIHSMPDTLRMLLMNDALLIKKGLAGKRKVEKLFSESEIISKYQSIYSSLINR